MNIEDRAKVLLVDDDVAYQAEILAFLEPHGFQVDVAGHVTQARQRLKDTHYALVLLDLILPGIDGQVLCREIRQKSRTPIVVTSAIESDEERITLLNLGADDYLVKPFNMNELLARMRAVMRRANVSVGLPRIRSFGPWSVDANERRLTHEDGRVVTLTPSEAQVLRHFLANPDMVFGRGEILAVARMRQHGGANDRSVDNLIKRLRRKVEAAPEEPQFIETVWGEGYAFRPGLRS